MEYLKILHDLHDPDVEVADTEIDSATMYHNTASEFQIHIRI